MLSRQPATLVALVRRDDAFYKSASFDVQASRQIRGHHTSVPTTWPRTQSSWRSTRHYLSGPIELFWLSRYHSFLISSVIFGFERSRCLKERFVHCFQVLSFCLAARASRLLVMARNFLIAVLLQISALCSVTTAASAFRSESSIHARAVDLAQRSAMFDERVASDPILLKRSGQERDPARDAYLSWLKRVDQAQMARGIEAGMLPSRVMCRRSWLLWTYIFLSNPTQPACL